MFLILKHIDNLLHRVLKKKNNERKMFNFRENLTIMFVFSDEEYKILIRSLNNLLKII